MMRQMFELVVWVAASGLLLTVMGAWQLAQAANFGRPGQLLGITFTANEGEGRPESMPMERQTSEMTTPLDEGIKRALILRELELEGSLQARQLSNKELLHRLRLNQLLDAISASIPSAKPTRAPAKDMPEAAPIYRSGRTFPSRESAANDNYRRLRLASDIVAGPSGHQTAWETSSLALEGHPASTMSRKSGILGIVWPNERLISASSTPPFYSIPASGQRAKQMAQVEPGQGAQPASSFPTIYGANQQRNRASGQQFHEPPAAQAAKLLHRPSSNSGGGEEVPLHTAIRSESQSQNADYEWKRIEGSRWNNLRGMWGKRAAMSDAELNLGDKFKELVEQQGEQADEHSQDVDGR